MKRLILSAIAISMLALPVAQAQAGPRKEPQRYEQQHNQWKKGPGYDQKRHGYDQKRYGYDKKRHGYDQKQHSRNDYRNDRRYSSKNYWQRGHQVPAWQRKNVVKDYHRYGLHRPGHGQQWVKVDNDFLLISIASGIIGGIFASQF